MIITPLPDTVTVCALALIRICYSEEWEFLSSVDIGLPHGKYLKFKIKITNLILLDSFVTPSKHHTP